MVVRPPVLFIHGAFGNPDHFAEWNRFFSAAGYDCRAPALHAARALRWLHGRVAAS
jgi:esterase/lipase